MCNDYNLKKLISPTDGPERRSWSCMDRSCRGGRGPAAAAGRGRGLWSCNIKMADEVVARARESWIRALE